MAATILPYFSLVVIKNKAIITLIENLSRGAIPGSRSL